MSYQVLARKWRPKLFDEVVGQQHVLTILSNALSLGRVHHAYLFSGTRGVGKTSIARLLAKGLNCEKGITAQPCGKCANCLDIEQGRFVDLLEIDAASRTKVEDTREIIDNVQYLPTRGRFKVYLIDEVHMLSRSSFNALLKTLEEPPEHVKFLLATTESQKLPITILSRCLHLHLSVLDRELISKQLEKILHTENIAFDEKAVQLLAKNANGSMRDGLSLTDQAIALGNGKVDLTSVTQMLGALDKSIPFSLIEAVYQGDGNTLMQHIELVSQQGIDWDNLLAETIALLHQIAILQVVPTAFGDFSDYEERISYLAQYISPDDVQLFYQILLMGRKDLTYAPDKKTGVEMSFLRALAFKPKTVLPDDLTKLQPSETLISQAHTVSLSQPITQKTSHDNKALTPSSTKDAAKESSAAQLPDDVSDVTKNILSIRQQLAINKQDVKKSKPIEEATPETHRSVKKMARQNQRGSLKDKLSLPDGSSDKEEDDLISAKNYQWQFSANSSLQHSQDDALSASKLKQEFIDDKTPELTQKLVQEAASIDSWSAEIEAITMPPLIKQIAINAFIEQQDETHIILHLRSEFKHLIQTPSNIKKLNDYLSNHRGQKIELQIIIDDNPQHLTPMEVREKIYQQKLIEAKNQINSDEKVKIVCQLFEAKIDESTIRPV